MSRLKSDARGKLFEILVANTLSLGDIKHFRSATNSPQAVINQLKTVITPNEFQQIVDDAKIATFKITEYFANTHPQYQISDCVWTSNQNDIVRLTGLPKQQSDHADLVVIVGQDKIGLSLKYAIQSKLITINSPGIGQLENIFGIVPGTFADKVAKNQEQIVKILYDGNVPSQPTKQTKADFKRLAAIDDFRAHQARVKSKLGKYELINAICDSTFQLPTETPFEYDQRIKLTIRQLIHRSTTSIPHVKVKVNSQKHTAEVKSHEQDNLDNYTDIRLFPHGLTSAWFAGNDQNQVRKPLVYLNIKNQSSPVSHMQGLVQVHEDVL